MGVRRWGVAVIGLLKVASGLLTKPRIRTPIAFFSRIVWVPVALIFAPLYSPLGDLSKGLLSIVGVLLFVAIGIYVGFLTYTKPDILLYGAEEHLEKWKYHAAPKGSTAD
jgi:hypothetical protein